MTFFFSTNNLFRNEQKLYSMASAFFTMSNIYFQGSLLFTYTTAKKGYLKGGDTF